MRMPVRRVLLILLAGLVLPAAGLIVFLLRNSEPAADSVRRLRGQEMTIIPGRVRQVVHQQPAEKNTVDVWQVVYLGGRRIGYSRTEVHLPGGSDSGTIHTETEMTLRIRRFGQPTRMHLVRRTRETADGELLSFELDSSGSAGAGGIRSRGRVVANRLEIETREAGRMRTYALGWRPGAKSPAWQDRATRVKPMKPGEGRRFLAFLPQLNRFSEIRLSAGDFRRVKLPDGSTQNLLQVTVRQTATQGSPVTAWLAADGTPVLTEVEFLGKPMVTWTVTSDTALTQMAGPELDLGLSTLIRVRPIRNAHQTLRVVYRVRMPGSDPTRYFPAGPTQAVKSLKPDTAELTVTVAKSSRQALHVRAEREYLKSSSMLACNDLRVVEHARRVDPYESNPTRLAIKMERYVYEKLKRKNFSTALASAARVARRMEGDCTEHAVLLAAMLRARRIPSRIVVGLVYLGRESAFGGHMWTEAWLAGRWIPFDATLGRGGIGAAHIKLADSSFSDKGPAPASAFIPLMRVLGKTDIVVVQVDGGNRLRSPTSPANVRIRPRIQPPPGSSRSRSSARRAGTGKPMR